MSAPSDSQYNQVVEQLKAEGLQITAESKTHLWISVSAEKEVFEKTFLAEMNEVQSGRFQLKSAARIPAYLGLVVGVTGLDSTRQRRPLYRLAQQKPMSAPTQGVVPKQIKSIYGLDPIYQLA